MSEIRFSQVHEPYGEFSIYSSHTIRIKGKRYYSVQHFYQASKFLGPNSTEESRAYAELIRNTRSTKIANFLGSQRKPNTPCEWHQQAWDIVQQYPNVTIRPDWLTENVRIMRIGNFNKFYFHPQLRKMLVGTGSATIVEHTSMDGFWGDGGDGTGKNMLGRILMEIREVFNPVTDHLILNMILTSYREDVSLVIDLADRTVSYHGAIKQLIEALNRGQVSCVLNVNRLFKVIFYSRLYQIGASKIGKILK